MDTFLQFFYLWIIVIPLLIGFVFGRIAEARHYKSLIRREAELAEILVFSDRLIPDEFNGHGGLVVGSVVLSNDYFQKLMAGLKGIFGGNIKPYESLLVRARREAVLRMKAEAKSKGGTSVFNVKLETSIIGGGGRRTTTSIEVLAYGTAVFRDRYGRV
ncbi:MAG: heavy metal-binding domain-containing protein [Sphingomonadales bacterium]